jgi:hypothetical protein
LLRASGKIACPDRGKIGRRWEKFYDVTGRRKAFIICGLRGDSRYPRYRDAVAGGWTDEGAKGCRVRRARRKKSNEDGGGYGWIRWMRGIREKDERERENNKMNAADSEEDEDAARRNSKRGGGEPTRRTEKR